MKTSLLLILALALAGTLRAQEFNGGIHAGFDIASERDTWPNRLGLYTGIFTSRYVSERSSLQLELNYVQKGNRNRIDIDNADDYKLRLHYLELQFLYHYDIKRFTIETGPSLGWLVAYNEELNGNKIDDNPFEPLI